MADIALFSAGPGAHLLGAAGLELWHGGSSGSPAKIHFLVPSPRPPPRPAPGASEGGACDWGRGDDSGPMAADLFWGSCVQLSFGPARAPEEEPGGGGIICEPGPDLEVSLRLHPLAAEYLFSG